jgi:putative ABC transport system permease protein
LAILLAYDRRVALICAPPLPSFFASARHRRVDDGSGEPRTPRPRNRPRAAAKPFIGQRTDTDDRAVLGTCITLLVTVIEIDGNLSRQFSNELPARAPSFYFLDIPADQSERFGAFLRVQAPSAKLEEVPMLRGRIVSAGGIPAENIKPKEDAAWVLQSDRGLTYGNEIPSGSRLVEGKWWRADYDGPPLVSFEKRIADGLGLKLGDPVVVNVLGRNITATIANMRTVDWESLGINFVMVFSSNSFRGAPHTHLATLTYPDGGTPLEEANVIRSVAESFPVVTAVRVKDVLEAVGSIVANLVLAIRGASAITLIAAALVLGGALAAGHRSRVYDAVILKTLGATRLRLLTAYAIEYLLIGTATAVFGVIGGSLAAWLIVAQLMHLSFTWLPEPALAAALAAVAVTVTLGLAGTYVALGQKPAPILRNL